MLRRRFVLPTLICVVPFALVACGEKAQTDSRTDAPLVRVAIARTATPTPRAFTGTVAARVQSGLGFRVSGKVLERLVDTGQAVKRGQPLMRIDSVDLKLAAHAHAHAALHLAVGPVAGPSALNIFSPFNGWFATVTGVVEDGARFAVDIGSGRIRKWRPAEP